MHDRLLYVKLAVEPKNCLDSTNSKDASLNQFVKAPANLVVLEGDCLDTTGNGTELESYLVWKCLLFCYVVTVNHLF